MTKQKVLLAFYLSLVTGVLFADERSYNIVGIVYSESANYMSVVVEFSDGSQRLLHKGDIVGNETISDIYKNEVRLNSPDGERTISLTAGESDLSVGENPEPIDHGVKQISKNIITQFDRLAARKKNDKTLEAEINTVLGLPKEARIVAIDDTSVNTARAGLTVLRKSLSTGQPLRISITGATELEALYLLPAAPEEVQQGNEVQ